MRLGIRFVLIDCVTGAAVGDAYMLKDRAEADCRHIMCTNWYPNKVRVEAVELVLPFNSKGDRDEP